MEAMCRRVRSLAFLLESPCGEATWRRDMGLRGREGRGGEGEREREKEKEREREIVV